jgi:mannose-6-phosphate isomerase-like protein (cupin superfamily)
MQHVVTGLGPDGRSTVLERRDLSEPPGNQVVVETIAGTDELPPRLLASLAGQGEAANIGVPQVGSSWLIVKWPANSDAYMHRTDTLDYDVVLSGQVTLLLEDGEVVLRAGDSVVIPGVRHGWRAGPEGCVSSVVLLALE